jgi:predicted ArsR family transcriptional regulator
LRTQLSLLKKRRAAIRQTSLRAYDSAKEQRSLTQAKVLLVLRVYGPATDDEIAARLDFCHISPSGLRTRRSELVRAGKVKACGTTTNSRGRSVTLWGLA